jgi:hypothetical protein
MRHFNKHKTEFDVEIKRFHSYEINHKGKWKPFYILGIEKNRSSGRTQSSSSVGSEPLIKTILTLTCIDIKNKDYAYKMIEAVEFNRDKEDQQWYGHKSLSKHIRPIDTDQSLNKLFLVQLYKLENL